VSAPYAPALGGVGVEGPGHGPDTEHLAGAVRFAMDAHLVTLRVVGKSDFVSTRGDIPLVVAVEPVPVGAAELENVVGGASRTQVSLHRRLGHSGGRCVFRGRRREKRPGCRDSARCRSPLSRREVSNPAPDAYKASALPDELRRLVLLWLLLAVGGGGVTAGIGSCSTVGAVGSRPAIEGVITGAPAQGVITGAPAQGVVTIATLQ
jgi:hypothetical protein